MAVFERTTLSNGIRVLTAPMPQAQSVSCFVMFAAGSRYETPEIGGIAHFAEHMFFKGTERRPTARDISAEIDGIGGEFNAFTGKEYTGYYVKCAAGTRDVALDVLVDMIRNSRFDPEEIEREKGVIVEEMNMYFDTPRDFVGGVYDELLYGDHPLGRDIIGTKETVRAATRETFTSFIDRWYRPERMVIGVGGRIGDDLIERLEELLGSIEPRETGMPEPAASAAERLARLGVHRSSPIRRTSCSARGAIRSAIPTGSRCSCSRRCSAAACRRASSPRCASVAGSPTTSSARTRATSTQARSTRRPASTSSASTTPSRRSPPSCGGSADEPVPAAELEKARAFAKGRFVLGIESPHGTIMYGLRREVLLGQAEEPEAMLAGLDAVTAEDIQRVAQDVVGKQLKLAVIGPFEDAERFERLLEPA